MRANPKCDCKMFVAIKGHVYVLLMDGTRDAIATGFSAIDRWVVDPQVPLSDDDAIGMRYALANPPFKVTE